MDPTNSEVSEVNPVNLSVPGLLDEDMSSVDTAVPLFADGIHEMEIVEVTCGPSKDKTGETLTVKMKTIKETKTIRKDPGTGQTITLSAGFPVTKWVGLTPQTGVPGKKDYTQDDVRRGVAQFMECVLGKAQKGVERRMTPLDKWKGQRLMLKSTIAPATEKFPESNNFAWVKPAMPKPATATA